MTNNYQIICPVENRRNFQIRRGLVPFEGGREGGSRWGRGEWRGGVAVALSLITQSQTIRLNAQENVKLNSALHLETSFFCHLQNACAKSHNLRTSEGLDPND